MRNSTIAIASALGLGACGGPNNAPKDAPPDVAIDSKPIDAPGCGTDIAFTGEFLDWDSNGASFCGIFQSVWQVHGDPARTHVTAPNGRVELCLLPTATTQIDITIPTAASQCTAVPDTYKVPGIAIIEKAVLDAGGTYSVRSITATELTQLGITLDPAKAQVFVHVDGTPRAVSITATHDAAFAFDGTTWALGVTGQDVFFPNSDPAGASTTIQVTNGAIGTGSVPLVANNFTYANVVAN